MAITVTNPSPAKFGFFLNATSADASGCEELKAAVAGKSIIVDHLTINNGAGGAQSITIGAGKTGAAVTTALLGPVAMAANTSLTWNFLNGGMKLTAATALTIDSSSNTDLSIFASGRVE
ncbi:MAG TPA: hypothetical protein PK874_12395 [Desulfobacteraceae bacterium]|nr:hypothetical protein [Desulfobacteraceae bacterium]HPQ28617.1 hypothetical protein [Desulfobacteraceae bacterium]